MIDRRQYPRTIVDSPARLLVDGRAIINCVVRNISADGACLECVETFIIPDDFDLILSRAEHACHVVRRGHGKMGVSFRHSGESGATNGDRPK